MAGSLDLYHRKRDFGITSEPKGRAVKRAGTSFVVQKHAARRLHYDFRLELDGVLKSWAVAKGPSLVPGEKRLAVHVEDHPLDYGTFEGTIPDGQYGAGTVLLWDKGTWTPEYDAHKGLAKGHLEFTLDGEKLKGRWHLVRMRGKPNERTENWLLIKSEDDEARTEADPDILDEKPRSVKSQKDIEQIAGDRKARQWSSGRAAAGGTPATVGGGKTPRQRAAEPLDASAATAAVAAQPAAKRAAKASAKTTTSKAAASKAASSTSIDVSDLVPKRGKAAKQPDFVEPELATLSEKAPAGSWLHEIKFDGYRMQAVRAKAGTRMRTRRGLDWTDRFAAIADSVSRLPLESVTLDGEVVVEDQNGVSDFAALQQALSEGRDAALVYYVFDCLYLDGQDLRALPLRDRKEIVRRIVAAAPPGPLRYSEHFEEHGETMLQHACQLSAEGIISKKPDAPYRSGRVGGWLKSKCTNRQEFVVIGYVPSTAAKRAVGSLVLGYYDGKALVHAGRTGTGFTATTASEIFKLLDADVVATPPTDAPVPADARRNVKWVKPTRVAEIEFRGWTGQNQLRQASFKGLREDKDPHEIVREKAIATANSGRADTSAAAKKASNKAGASKPSSQSAVQLTHPDRLLWPEAGVTKQGLADYYAAVWPWIEPYVTGRPLSLVRCPTGITRGCFFQKHKWEGMNAHILELKDPQEAEANVGLGDLDGLMGLVQASVLEIHPWGARANDLDHPDLLTMDLDPGDGVGWGDLVAAARDVRARMKDVGLTSFVKTTGGKGLHVVVPLTPRADWDEAKAFCKQIADSMAADAPDRYIAKSTKAARNNKIFVDYLRNGRGATAVAAYSTRARPSCGVSTPLAWEELDTVGSAGHFTLANVEKRLSHLKRDPWAAFFKTQQTLPSLDATPKTSVAKKTVKPKTARAKAPVKAPARKR